MYNFQCVRPQCCSVGVRQTTPDAGHAPTPASAPLSHGCTSWNEGPRLVWSWHRHQTPTEGADGNGRQRVVCSRCCLRASHAPTGRVQGRVRSAVRSGSRSVLLHKRRCALIHLMRAGVAALLPPLAWRWFPAAWRCGRQQVPRSRLQSGNRVSPAVVATSM